MEQGLPRALPPGLIPTSYRTCGAHAGAGSPRLWVRTPTARTEGALAAPRRDLPPYKGDAGLRRAAVAGKHPACGGLRSLNRDCSMSKPFL